MDKIVDFLKDIEQALLIISNIITLVYGIWISIKSKKWKQTAKFFAVALNKQQKIQVEKMAVDPTSYSVADVYVNGINVECKINKYVDKVLAEINNN